MADEWSFRTATGVASVGESRLVVDRSPVPFLRDLGRRLRRGSLGVRLRTLAGLLAVPLVALMAWQRFLDVDSATGVFWAVLSVVVTMHTFLGPAYRQGVRTTSVDRDDVDRIYVSVDDLELRVTGEDFPDGVSLASLVGRGDATTDELTVDLPDEDAATAAAEVFRLRGVDHEVLDTSRLEGSTPQRVGRDESSSGSRGPEGGRTADGSSSRGSERTPAAPDER